MSAQINSTTETLFASNQQKQKEQANSGTSSVFADLLQGKVPSNIVFTRAESQLVVPRRTDAQVYNDQAPAAQDSRDEPIKTDDPADAVTGAGHGSEPADDRTAQHYHRETGGDDVAAADTPQQTGQDSAPADSTSKSAGAADSGKQNNAQAGAANTNAQKAAAANGNNVAQIKSNGTEATEMEFAALSRQGSNKKTDIKASVTTKAAEVVSTPNGNLAAGTAVASQAAKSGQSTGQTAEADAALTLEPQVEAAARNSSTRNQNGHGNSNGTQTGAQAKAGKTGAEQAQAQAAQAAMQNANFNNALSAAAGSNAQAAAKGAASSSAGPVLTVDATTGGTAVTGENGSIQRNAPAQAPARARPAVPPQVVAEQVAVNIQRAIGQGADQINIQLRPQQLGGIEVKMEVGQDGRMTAVITAERADTLDMLRSDSKALVQALGDAGLQADASSLSFNLKGQEGQNDSQFAGNNSSKNGGEDGTEDLIDGTPPEGLLAEGETAEVDADGRLDVKV